MAPSLGILPSRDERNRLMHAKGPSEPSRPQGAAPGNLVRRGTLKRAATSTVQRLTMLLNQRFYRFTIRSNQQFRVLCYKTSTMAYTTDAGSSAPAPWYVNYPAPKKEAAIVSREDVLRMLCDARNSASKDFVLVDLRRNDHEVCTWAWPPRLSSPSDSHWCCLVGV